MEFDLLIINGNCYNAEENGIVKNWIAIKNGRIAKTGTGKKYENIKRNAEIIIDAKGGSILPGFIDSHFHLVQTALNKSSMDLSEAKSFEDIGKAIEREKKSKKSKDIIGVRLKLENLKEKCFPDRMVLDKYCSDIPVWINSADYQVSMLNTYGLLYYKIPFRSAGVELDEKQVVTGVFRGSANAMLRTNILELYENVFRRNNVDEMMKKLISVGITSINAMEGGYMYSDKDAEFLIEYEENFPVDLILFYQSMDVHKIKSKNLKRIGGSLYLDGTIGSRTAALSTEYADMPGSMGSLRFLQRDLNEFVTECYKNKMQLALYAIGDRAIEEALNAHEYALYHTGIKGLRHRIEHAVLITSEQLKRAADMGIVLSMSPTYEKYWGGKGKMYQERLGESYIETNKFREIFDSGVILCGGSDSDVCEYNPLIGIHMAVNHPVASHRISIREAIRMYTLNAAYAVFAENEKGSLEEGKIADIAILDKDIEKINSSEIKDLKVTATIKAGEVLYNIL